MSILRRLGIVGALAVCSFFGISGCGGSTNNDQGTSLLALGFFEDGTGEVGDVGTLVYINQDVPFQIPGQASPLFVPVDKDLEEEGLQGGFLGIENRLTSQFVRMTRMDCDYDIQGSSVAVPSDSWGFTTVLGPAPDGTEDTGNTTGGTSNNITYSQVIIVSPAILSFIANNLNNLPELPYRMTAVCTAIGVSQAGDVFETNEVFYSILFDEADAATFFGSAAAVGAGTGGDFSSFGDADEEDAGTAGAAVSGLSGDSEAGVSSDNFVIE